MVFVENIHQTYNQLDPRFIAQLCCSKLELFSHVHIIISEIEIKNLMPCQTYVSFETMN